MVARLLGLYRDDADAGTHGAVGWLLRTWGEGEKLKEIDRGLATGRVEGGRQWYVNRQGQTLVVFPAPGEVVVGVGPGRYKARIDGSFAIAAREVTVGQFRKFRKDHEYEYAERFAPSEECPVNKVSWYDAAAYCNWLSEQEGVRKDQWCYLPNKGGEYAAGMRMAPGWRGRTGYRLPTEAEWEHACRAGSVTDWSCGWAGELLEKYGWYDRNSVETSHPVGMLKPNDAGLFDMHGNAWEWCQDRVEQPGKDNDDIEDMTKRFSRMLRGGSFEARASVARSAYRVWYVQSHRSVYVGFRPVRTFR
jgi:formylglycine-generating enzyme required for sulfatase activity